MVKQVDFINSDKYRLKFYNRRCSQIAITPKEIDVLGRCDGIRPLLLQEGVWVKLHVTTQRSANVTETAALTSNAYCPYKDEVKCFTLEISEKASELHMDFVFASVNCVSGKIF